MSKSITWFQPSSARLSFTDNKTEGRENITSKKQLNVMLCQAWQVTAFSDVHELWISTSYWLQMIFIVLKMIVLSNQIEPLKITHQLKSHQLILQKWLDCDWLTINSGVVRRQHYEFY